MTPEELIAKALKMNNGKPLTDKRTKGARYLKWCKTNQDYDAELADYIKSRLENYDD